MSVLSSVVSGSTVLTTTYGIKVAEATATATGTATGTGASAAASSTGLAARDVVVSKEVGVVGAVIFAFLGVIGLL
jgi:hypothetical protein